MFVTQGKLRENTGNFILTRMWPPCIGHYFTSVGFHIAANVYYSLVPCDSDVPIYGHLFAHKKCP